MSEPHTILRLSWTRAPWIFTPIAQLILSGLLGVVRWPPPGMSAYRTIIEWTGIVGPEGGMIRIGLGCAALLAWALPWRWLRHITYVGATLCCLLIALSFGSTGQGFSEGLWWVGVAFGAATIWIEGRHGRLARQRADARGARGGGA